MRVGVTGTPGVGKTTVARRLADRLGAGYVDLTEEVRDGADAGYDEDRGVRVADIDALNRRMRGMEEAVLDGHVAHSLDVGFVVVLRCEPSVLRDRLRERGWDEPKVRENAESEALDVVLAEALGEGAPVFESDTTDASVGETVDRVADAVRDGEERHGVVDWSAHLGVGGGAEGSV